MRITEQNFEKLLNNNFDNLKYKAILIYGSDYGQTEEKVSKLKKIFYVIKTIYIEKSKVDFAKILDLLAAQELFKRPQENQALVIKINSSSFNDDFFKNLAQENWQGLLIFQAPELWPSSILRKLFEQQQNFLALPCYLDDQNSIKLLFKKSMLENQINYDKKIEEIIEHYILSGDRLIIKNELEKLINFAGPEKNLKLDDIVKFLSIEGDSEVENLVFNLFLRKATYFEINLENCLNKGVAISNVINSMNKFITNLQQIRSKLKLNMSIDESINSLSPKIFYKHVFFFKESLNLWDDAKLNYLIAKLYELDSKLKKDRNNNVEFFKFFIYQEILN